MAASSADLKEEADQLHGARIISEIKKAGITHVLSVPDLHTSQGLLFPIADDPDLELIRVCKEDECLGIAAGLTYGDKRSLILLQYTGFLYAMNAIRAVGCDYKSPSCLMIGMLGKEPGVLPQDSQRFGLRIIEPILDTMAIPRILVETDDDVGAIAPAIDKAYETPYPTAVLIGRRPI